MGNKMSTEVDPLVDETLKTVSRVTRVYEALCGLIGEQLTELGPEKIEELMEAEGRYHRIKPIADVLMKKIKEAQGEDKIRLIKIYSSQLNEAFIAATDFVGLLNEHLEKINKVARCFNRARHLFEKAVATTFCAGGCAACTSISFAHYTSASTFCVVSINPATVPIMAGVFGALALVGAIYLGYSLWWQPRTLRAELEKCKAEIEQAQEIGKQCIEFSLLVGDENPFEKAPTIQHKYRPVFTSCEEK